MRLTRMLAALVLALALTGCGDDDSDDTAAPKESPQADQAASILDCTSKHDLPGSIGQLEGGVLVLSLPTEDETIVIDVLGSEAAAAEDKIPGGLDHEQVANAVIIGNAITPANRSVIKSCIEDSAAG